MATQPETPPTTDEGGGDSGTNPETRTLEQTQATNGVDADGYAIGYGVRDETGALSNLRRNSETGDLYDPGGIPSASANIDPGVGAYDDTGTGSPEDTSAGPTSEISAPKTVTATYSTTDLFKQQIVPQPNVLDKFGSYTYHASLYLMSTEQFTQLMVSNKKTVNGYQLLMQSGGAPGNTGGFQSGLAPTLFENDGQGSSSNAGVPTANQASAGRSPAFPDDFYFDSITIENRLIGGETRAAHSATAIKFTIVEPNGITLIDRLYQAVQDYMSKDGKTPINYNAVTYLMVIRFYGYDENGNIQPGIKGSDSNSIIEKFIPFRISELNWSIQNKLVQYNIVGAPTQLVIGNGTRRGTIPYDIQLSASSVSELLGIGVSYQNTETSTAAPGESTTYYENDGTSSTSSTAPPNASAAPSTKKILKQGLMGAMNEFQQKLVEQGIYEVADEYNIVFAKGAEKIASAKIVPPGTKVESKQTPMSPVPTQSAESLEMSRVSKDTSVRNWSVTAGMQVVQAIELAIRNSTYILNQQLVQDDPTSDAVINNPGADGKPVTWYQISFKAVPKKPYDKLRNDYAYKITFEISPFRIENYNSKYFPVNKFRGLHKSYQYWFTGKNTAVLDYQENMNNLYNITVSGTDEKNSQAAIQRRVLTSSMRDIPFYNYQAASTETRQGSEGKAFEGSSNLAEVLYDPQGLAHAKLKIVGDPAWIQQGSMAGGVNAKEFNYSAFLPDGTINFDASQILFEIAWQRPQDYNLQTGLADPYSNNPSSPRQPLQSRVYTATKVVSEFAHGKFEQTVEGQLYYFVKPNATNKAANTSLSNTQGSDPRDAEAGNGRGSRGKSQAAANSMNRGQSGTKGAPSNDQGSAIAGTDANSTTESTPTPNDQVQPSPPPDAPTSGSGEPLSWYDNDAAPPPQTLARLAEAGIEEAPSGPQDISREA